MENNGIVIKTEPIDEEIDTLDNRQRDEINCFQSASVRNGFASHDAAHGIGIPGAFPATGTVQESKAFVGNANFSCLLCDVVCQDREDLRMHLKNDHKSKSNYFAQGPAQRADFYSSYVHFRYSCNVCGAKFKTFKNYFSHSMSHKGYTNFQSSLSDAMLQSGKEVLQNYFDTEEGLPGTFKCHECNTVFVQRDSYAMHMMMRAMKETCRPDPNEANSLLKIEQTDDSGQSQNNQDDVVPRENETKLLDNDVTESNSTESQKCLEDVTTKVDQDEYLKSVLDRVVTQNDSQHVFSDLRHSEGSRPCLFCAQPFPDQDSLAMHVMSVHAEQMLVAKPHRNNVVAKPRDNIKWINPYIYPLDCKVCGKKFVSRDNLAMHVLTHAQEEARPPDSARDSSIYQWKRKADMLTMTSEEPLSSHKATRRFGNLGNNDNLVSDKHVLSASDLYCSSCSIQFYSKGDFEWHSRCRHSSGTKDEPLCLAKPESKDFPDKSDSDASDADSAEASRKPKRRNSFSVDEQSRHPLVAPKRPFSVDNVTEGTASTRANNYSNAHSRQVETYDLKSKDLKIKKEIQKSMAIACVDALSSNEKRIIYSVFGSDLMKSKDSEDMEQGVKDQRKETNQQSNIGPTPQTNACMTNHFSPLSTEKQIPKTSPNSASELGENLHETLKGKDAAMCRYCEIIFLNKAVYYLHMGLHNVNNQWQCNVCGKICKNSVDFAAHIIHM